MSSQIKLLTGPMWYRSIKGQTTGLKYKNFFLSDERLAHIRYHTIYGPMLKYKSRFLLNPCTFEDLKQIHSVYEYLFTRAHQVNRQADCAILLYIKAQIDIINNSNLPKNASSWSIDPKTGRHIHDTIISTSEPIGYAPHFIKTQPTTIHVNTSKVRTITEPYVDIGDPDPLQNIITSFPYE